MESRIWKNVVWSMNKCSFNISFTTSSQDSFTSWFNPHTWSRVLLAIILYPYYLGKNKKHQIVNVPEFLMVNTETCLGSVISL